MSTLQPQQFPLDYTSCCETSNKNIALFLFFCHISSTSRFEEESIFSNRAKTLLYLQYGKAPANIDFICFVNKGVNNHRHPVVVGHGPQSMMGLSIDSSSVAMNLRTVRISKSQKNQLQELEITKMEVSPILVV